MGFKSHIKKKKSGLVWVRPGRSGLAELLPQPVFY